jgi:SET domain-containing protein 6
LPTEFNTPIFFSPEEIEELTGTAIVGASLLNSRMNHLTPYSDKIGKVQAEKDFEEKVLPTIQVRVRWT